MKVHSSYILVTYCDSDTNHDYLRKKIQTKERGDILVPFGNRNFHHTTHHTDHGGPKEIRISISKLKSKNCQLAAKAAKISKRCHNRHGDGCLGWTGWYKKIQ